MPSSITLPAVCSARAGNSSVQSGKARSAPYVRGLNAREVAALSQKWPHRGRGCGVKSSQNSHHQYQQRLRDARVAADLEFSRLLSGADLGKRRARSATDAGVLRRKG
jgi:hypothetical protein